jgi:hypothetical protein
MKCISTAPFAVGDGAGVFVVAESAPLPCVVVSSGVDVPPGIGTAAHGEEKHRDSNHDEQRSRPPGA